MIILKKFQAYFAIKKRNVKLILWWAEANDKYYERKEKEGRKLTVVEFLGEAHDILCGIRSHGQETNHGCSVGRLSMHSFHVQHHSFCKLEGIEKKNITQYVKIIFFK